MQPPTFPEPHAERAAIEAQRLDASLKENPRLRLTTINLRREDKRRIVQLQAWWSLRGEESLTQWDAITRLLTAALHDPDVRAAFASAKAASPPSRKAEA